MKFRNFIIVLLAIFMVFALASCKHEPEVKPTPDEPQPAYSEDVIYKLTATKGRNLGWWSADKFVLSFSADAEKVSKGDVLTLKYRSTREITQFNIRNSSNKWIYEQPKKSSGKDYPLPEGFKSEPDADGWITVTFTFGDNWWDGSEITSTTYPSAWRIDFIGEIVTTDVLEVKDIKLTKSDSTVVPLALTQTKVSDTGAYGNILPTFEDTHDATWQESADWVVFFFNGEPGEVDGTPEYERVFNGMAFTRDWTKDDKGVAYPEKEHYTLKLLKGYATNSEEFDPKTPITENTRLYVIYVGDPQQVTFAMNGAAEEPAQTVEYGKTATKPADPTKEGTDLFAGWYVGDTPFDFDTPITADTVISAHWGAPTLVEFNTQAEGLTVDSQTIPAGTKAKEPDALTRVGYRFDGWYTASTCEESEKFDFATPITEAKVLYAGWTPAKVVTFNLNYENAPEAEIDYVEEGGKATKPAVDPMRAGYVFAGWYEEAGCTNAYNFDDAINTDTELFAKWTTGTMSRLVITRGTMEDGDENSDDKFILTFQNDANAKVKAGDVLSLSFRSNRTFAQYTIRGDAKWFHEKKTTDKYPQFFKTFETGEDGWTTVTYDFPAEGTQEAITYGETGTWFRVFFRLQSLVKGDILEVRAVTLNGKELVLSADNVGEHGAPTFETDLADYEWTAHNVSFVVGEGVTPIDPISVPFCTAVALPANPEKDGFGFMGWFTDAECENAFVETTLIREDTVLYAKWVEAEKRTVTFNLNYTDCPDASTTQVYDGFAVAKPEDPVRAGYFFDGWTTDAEGTAAYNFETVVTADLPLYAQWTQAVTLTVNVNFGATPESKTFTVRKGTTPVVKVGRPGYYLSKLTEGTAVDSTTYTVGALEADTTVYAQWEEPAKYYKLTATKGSNGSDGKENSQDKFALQWSSDIVVNAGDVVSMAFKPVRTDDDTKNRSFTYSIRGAGKWFAEKGSGSYPQFWSTFDQEDGWIYVTYVFPSDLSGVKEPKKVSYPGTFRIDIRDTHIAVGDNADVVYIKALAINGVKIELDEATTSSQYACPDIKYENLSIE